MCTSEILMVIVSRSAPTDLPLSCCREWLHLDAWELVSLWEPLQLASDPLGVHLFDLETGLRLDDLQRVRISANHAGSRVGRPPLVVQPCTVTPVA